MQSKQKSKIYTRGGDKGETSLIFGERVGKDNPRVTAYGTVDELNASLGIAASFITNQTIKKVIQSIQNELFNIGAQLASQKGLKKKSGDYYQLEMSKIAKLEPIIDYYDAKLPPLRTFILPSGTKAATFLHLARTVCRRTERKVVTLSKKEKINPTIVAYLNRLSDLLFVLARYLNKKAGRKELPWKKD